jgi:hypothetical protein
VAHTRAGRPGAAAGSSTAWKQSSAGPAGEWSSSFPQSARTDLEQQEEEQGGDQEEQGGDQEEQGGDQEEQGGDQEEQDSYLIQPT